MGSKEEWKQHKLERLESLSGLTFQLANYTPPTADWDHDHCEGCWSKFASFDAPEILHRGYFTSIQVEDEPTEEPEFIQQARESGRKVMAKPDAKKWVCRECFEEFRHILDLRLKPSKETW